MGTLRNNGRLTEPFTPPPQTPLEKEIADTRFQMEVFRRRGNGFGCKQAKAHLGRLLRKQRSEKQNDRKI